MKVLKISDIPPSIQLAWHGVNDPLNLQYFLDSTVPWCEIDLRQDAQGNLIHRHDPFDTHPLRSDETLLKFSDCLAAIQRAGKCLKVDLKEGGETLNKMIRMLKDKAFDETRLWITTNLKDVSLEDYGRLREQFPRAIIQSTIPHRFMFEVMTEEDRKVWLEMNRGLGVNRLSICWYDEPTREEIQQLKAHQFEVNLYHVNSLEDFNRAIALEPEGITSDFHVPEWDLYGRGPGENGFYLEKSELK